MATFLSYSRRQLYFAESLALHLQKEGVEVWFDLQQLQAGKVWADGLDSGVETAEKLVLVASRASLESPYTRDEWQGVAARGQEIVLAVYEPVELPEELRGRPTFDFRRDFDGKLRQLAAFLEGDAKPCHDRIPPPNRLGITLALPGAIWGTLAGLFAPLIGCLLGLLLALGLNPPGPDGPIRTAVSSPRFFWGLAAVALVVGCIYAVPLLRHRLPYKRVKRGLLVAMLLSVPAFFSFEIQHTLIPTYTPAALLLLTLFLYVVGVRRSAGLLRWMRPEEDLQKLRRRAHQPLVAKSAFDVDLAAERRGKAVTYALHADRADEPLVRYVDRSLLEAGHTRVAADADPDHHIAILSNRSSQAWAQRVTQAHAGRLVFVVASTIEFGESLKETGRYQWVDARSGDRRDVDTLARSLGDPAAWKQEAALEATPAMIDRWKVPPGITLLKRVMELYGVYLLIFCVSDLVGAVMDRFGLLLEGSQGSTPRSLFFATVGMACLWLAGRGLVYRRVPALVLYGVFAALVLLVARWGGVVPPELVPWWLAPAIVLPLLGYSAYTSGFWLPAFARANPDEVGIKRSIDRSFKRRSLVIVAVWMLLILGFVAAMLLSGVASSTGAG